jgi:K+-transporting ATPase A subunit
VHWCRQESGPERLDRVRSRPLPGARPAGRAAILNAGPHGLSEVVYAFTSSASSIGVALVLVFLTFLPALSLGPLAEGLR